MKKTITYYFETDSEMEDHLLCLRQGYAWDELDRYLRYLDRYTDEESVNIRDLRKKFYSILNEE